jgi:hypothetical protein
VIIYIFFFNNKIIIQDATERGGSYHLTTSSHAENVGVLGNGGEVEVVLHRLVLHISSFHETSARLLANFGVVGVILGVFIGEE